MGQGQLLRRAAGGVAPLLLAAGASAFGNVRAPAAAPAACEDQSVVAAVRSAARLTSGSPGGRQEIGEPPPGAPPLRLFVEPGLEAAARLLVSRPGVWAPFPGIGSLEEAHPDTLEIHLVRDLSRLTEIGLGRPEPWVAGTAEPGAGRVALRLESAGGGPATAAVLRHELAHVALEASTGGRAPRWLHEGYAQYATGQWGFEQAWRLRLLVLREGSSVLAGPPPRFAGGAADARLDYLLSYTLVHELAESGGESGLAALFEALRDGRELDAAIRRVYGLTLEQFERRWRRNVTDRYGWLFILSRAAVFWGGVTLLVGWVWWRRRRRDRERLEALRAAESSEEEGSAESSGEAPGDGIRGAPPAR